MTFCHILYKTKPKAAAATLASDATAAALGAVPAEEGATAETRKEQTPQLAADSSPAALGVLAPELCQIFLINSPWVSDRTIMLRMTSKRVKELVNHLRPSALVRWRRSFMDAKLNGTAPAKLQLVFRQLAALTAGTRIITLELCLDDCMGRYSHHHPCCIKGRDVERLAGVLAQCLIHLNLGGNKVGTKGTQRLAGVLEQCSALAHVNLSDNGIKANGAGSFAGVLAKCPALAHLDVEGNRGIRYAHDMYIYIYIYVS